MIDTEAGRIEAMRRFDRLDFNLNRDLHRLLKVATETFEAPAAFITLMDEHEQWFKVNSGFDVLNMPRETSFCTHTIRQNKPMIVSDTTRDVRFTNNPFVNNPPHIRFYAGAPLTTTDGHNIGTICIMDTLSKEVTEDKKEILALLARQAVNLMELDLACRRPGVKIGSATRQNKIARVMPVKAFSGLSDALVA